MSPRDAGAGRLAITTLPLGLPEEQAIVADRMRRSFDVVDLSGHKDWAERLVAQASDINAVLTIGFQKYDADLIAALPHLKIIAVLGVGYENIDVAAASEREVIVTHGLGTNAPDVAELAIAHMIALSRRMVTGDRFVRSGAWPEVMFPIGQRFTGSRVGIVGLGQVGRTLGRLLDAFSCEVGYFDPFASDQDADWRRFAAVEELAGFADYLVTCVPLSDQTRHLVGRTELAALGPRGVVVNVARGPVVDEAALVEAIDEGLIGGACLDVFEHEPLVAESIVRSDITTLTPHRGGATVQSWEELADLAARNIEAVLGGGAPITPVRKAGTG